MKLYVRHIGVRIPVIFYGFFAFSEILWPGGIKYLNVRFMVTDAAAYMLKAAINLKSLLSQSHAYYMFCPWP
jgi:hypothetical protein